MNDAAHQQAQIEVARFSRRADLAIKAELNEAFVLKQWRDIATADISEIMQYRRLPCGLCYEGLEYADVKHLPPVACCPHCHGEGGGETVYFADTRTLSPAARAVFAGVKSSKNGVEIKLRDQDAALLNIAKFLGMLVDKQEITGANGGPLTMVGVSAADLSDEQLALLVTGGQQQHQLDAPDAEGVE